MPLPINIENLVNSKTVESVRIEFKRSWNPYNIIRTVCAFANDIDEYGGGYIVIGIEENEGNPILPPYGVEQKDIDGIQREFFKLCNDNLRESIFPMIEPFELHDKWVIVIWVTTGEQRPYFASISNSKNSQMKIFVRHGSITKEANREQELRLRELANFKHFDDRINTRASINDINLGLIQSYLQETDSALFNESQKMSLEDLCIKMEIARGPNENIKPLNLGLLLFNPYPDNFFPGCITILGEIESESGRALSRKEFRGPIHIQIKNILDYLNTNVIKQHFRKNPLSGEPISFFNYPLICLREAVINALYHRSYEHQTPNEIRIYKYPSQNKNDLLMDGRRIEILSYPGPLPPIDENALAELKVIARNYRNLKLGQWLIKMKLVEKYALGIQNIVNSLEENGSPRPILSTDAERSIFHVVLNIHPDTPIDSKDFIENDKVFSLTNSHQNILEKFNEPIIEEELQGLFYNDIKDDLNYLIKNDLIKIKEQLGVKIFFITDKGRNALKTSF